MKLNEIGTLRKVPTKLSNAQTKINEIHKLCEEYNIHIFEIDPNDFTVSTEEDVEFEQFPFRKIPIKFKKIGGSLFIKNCENLESLADCPNSIGESLVVTDCEELKDFKGFPKEINKDFKITNCGISTLYGFPKVGRSIDISRNFYLKSLVGLPKEVNDKLILHNLLIKSFEGMSEIVNGSLLDISQCFNISSLDNLPRVINGTIHLTSLGEDTGNPPRNFLKLLKIKGLQRIKFAFRNLKEQVEAEKILNKWLPTRDIIECQEELIEAGLKEYARLK